MEDMDKETGEGFIELTMSTRLSRRDLARRAAVVGMAIPAVGAFISACGSDDKTSTDATDAAGGTEVSTGGTTAPAAGAGGTIRVATEKPAGALDPVAMQDLGTYGVVAQSFEFLCGLGDNDIGPGLASEWSPNADGSVWTFKLVEGATWQASGAPFTSADVAATLDRLVEAGNSGLKGVIDKGSVDSTDPNTAVITLLSPNGNFPYLVSLYNAQSVITPVDYATGTTLDAKPDGTGPWKLDKYDPNTGASFVRNDKWWGGTTPLDSTEFQFFTDLGTQVTAIQGKAVDAIVQFQVLGGDALLNDPDFNAIAFRATTHREIWMRCDTGQFADKRVRQALGFSVDRPALIDTLFRGKADLGNDHVIAPLYTYYDDSVPQRTRDIDKAKQLLSDAGFPDGIDVTLHAGDLQEIPQLAELIQLQAKEAGFNVEIALESLDTFYGAQWCPADPADPPCSGASEFGIVDYGHRGSPDVYLNAALSTGGVWNSSQYSSPEFDAAFVEFQKSVGVDEQRAACKKIETILLEDTPIVLPYWYNYLTGFLKTFTGVRVSALGQIFLDQAAKA